MLDILVTGIWKLQVNPIALRSAKTPQSFGHSECSRVKIITAEKDVFERCHLCDYCCM